MAADIPTFFVRPQVLSACGHFYYAESAALVPYGHSGFYSHGAVLPEGGFTATISLYRVTLHTVVTLLTLIEAVPQSCS